MEKVGEVRNELSEDGEESETTDCSGSPGDCEGDERTLNKTNLGGVGVGVLSMRSEYLHSPRRSFVTIPGTGGRVKFWADLRLDNLVMLAAIIGGIFYFGQIAQKYLDRMDQFNVRIAKVESNLAELKREETMDNLNTNNRIDMLSKAIDADTYTLGVLGAKIEDIGKGFILPHIPVTPP